MVAAFWASRERNQLLILATGLVVVVAATAYMQIRLNAWNQPFYNALTHKDMPAFIKQLEVFAELAAILLVLNVSQVWLNQTFRVVLRQGLVHDLLNEWLKPLRAFRLSNAGVIGQNPDQRLHADAQHLTDLMTDLGIGLLQATLLLLSFIGVLWVSSRNMILPFGGQRFHVPGYMVWCALFYAGTASLLSWLVGRPLIALDSERYAREANLRFALVRANQEIEGITIYGGEADEKAHLNHVFDSVLEMLRRIIGAMTRLTWITAGYGWFTIVAPILVAAPSYLTGEMSFGELMLVVGAFNQVQTSLRWFVDNFSGIADWRATLLRVASFRGALVTMDRFDEGASRIDLRETESPAIRLDDLQVAAPAGAIRLSERLVDLEPGERVLITGERGAERLLLFRAIIGIWPWGSGRITRPARASMMFLPARAYVPPGTLRSALCYPCATHDFDDAATARALASVGLERLQPLLDTTEQWDQRLNEDEKQCLAIARVILQRPQWVVLNGAFELLDPVSRRRTEALFTGELANIGLIDIGRNDDPAAFFVRRVQLLTDPQGPTFSPGDRLATATP
ncbi:MAG TPA: ABC transporter ATP-binding protein/permease [Steroidobacteraceae bacterium]|jgi:putative ATP-binding cassette transporter|nr:ABC transporter ATP-binding protein/permease [Steroidobacteraceae bacterium]